MMLDSMFIHYPVRISKLLLVSEVHDLREHGNQVQHLLEAHPVFSNLFTLERHFDLILNQIEKDGLIVSREWFSSGLTNDRCKLDEFENKLIQYIGAFNEHTLKVAIKNYCVLHSLPHPALSLLSTYRKLHPVFYLADKYLKLRKFLNLWDKRLISEGTHYLSGDVLIRGKWHSYSSFTGRVTAKNLPLTSLPRRMRSYIADVEGNELISIDIHAAELRFLAHWSNDPVLHNYFVTGKDPFSTMVTMLMIEDFLPEDSLRRLVKQVTYGLMYGAGFQTLLENTRQVHNGLNSKLLLELINKIKEQFLVAFGYLEERESDATLQTVLGQ